MGYRVAARQRQETRAGTGGRRLRRQSPPASAGKSLFLASFSGPFGRSAGGGRRAPGRRAGSGLRWRWSWRRFSCWRGSSSAQAILAVRRNICEARAARPSPLVRPDRLCLLARALGRRQQHVVRLRAYWICDSLLKLTQRSSIQRKVGLISRLCVRVKSVIDEIAGVQKRFLSPHNRSNRCHSLSIKPLTSFQESLEIASSADKCCTTWCLCSGKAETTRTLTSFCFPADEDSTRIKLIASSRSLRSRIFRRLLSAANSAAHSPSPTLIWPLLANCSALIPCPVSEMSDPNA